MGIRGEFQQQSGGISSVSGSHTISQARDKKGSGVWGLFDNHQAYGVSTEHTKFSPPIDKPAKSDSLGYNGRYQLLPHPSWIE